MTKKNALWFGVVLLIILIVGYYCASMSGDNGGLQKREDISEDYEYKDKYDSQDSNSSSYDSYDSNDSYDSYDNKDTFYSDDPYDSGYDDVYWDEDYDYDRYFEDPDYADGVDDAIDELEEEGEEW